MSRFRIYSLEQELKSLEIDVNQLTEEVISKAKQGMALLQNQVYGKIVEKAQEKLKARRELYLENLGMINSSDNVWVVYLKKPAEWIEEGLKPHNMIDNLTRSPKAKVAKDGSRYLVVPFKHNKPESTVSRAQLQIQQIVQQELKRMGLDKPIKRGGQPVLGRAVTLKTELTGPGMPVSRHGRPLLAGLVIYQHMVKGPSGKPQLRRDIMTFRTASTKQKGTGLWDHPGLQGVNFFDEVAKEVDQMWSAMLKDIVASIPGTRSE